MPMVWSEADGTRFNVSAYENYSVFNLSDSTGDHTLKSGKFRKLSPALKSAIRDALREAEAQLAVELAARDQSKAAIAAAWHDGLIRYGDGEPWYLAEKTLAGINYNCAKDCAETGFYQAHQFGKCQGGHASDTRLSCYYGCLVDGGIVMDISAQLDSNPALSVRSPMCDTHAVDVSRFADFAAGRDTWMLDVLAAPECFGGLATLAKTATQCREFSGFDYVPLSTWLAWWRDRGARLGQRCGNQIRWDDGQIEAIRPEAERWQSAE